MPTEKKLMGYNACDENDTTIDAYLSYRQAIDNRCKRFSNKTAITHMRDNGEMTTTTFSQMLDGHKQLYSLMAESKVVAGDRVALIAPHSPQGVLTALGLAYSNITTVLIDATLPASEINRLLVFSDVRACFTTNTLYSHIEHNVKNTIPCFELCDKENEYRWFSDSVSSSKSSKTPDPEKDVIAILFSSGTTAQMKGVKVTYASVMKACDVINRNVQWKPEYS